MQQWGRASSSGSCASRIYLPVWSHTYKDRPHGRRSILPPRFYAKLVEPVLPSEPDCRAASGSKLRRLRLLEHAADAVSLRCVQDPAVADPERDVVGGRVAVRHEIAGLGLGDGCTGLLLLVGVPRDQPSRCPEAHVHEPRAVDPLARHPTPEIRRAEQRPPELERLGYPRLEPGRIGI